MWVKIGLTAMAANANSLWVSTELAYAGDWYAMLRARASSQGGWELHWLANLEDGTWALIDYTDNLAVTSEFQYAGGDNGMLRADSPTISDWQRFYLYQVGSLYAFQSYYPPGSACCFVSTEIGYGGDEYAMLRARADAIGGWELYSLDGTIPYGPSSPRSVSSATPTVQPGSTPAILANAKHVPTKCKLGSGKAAPCDRLE